MNALERLRGAVRQAPVCLVEVVATQGSAPRGPGAWMAVQAEGLIGTIGTALIYLGIDPSWEKAIQGGIILAAISTDLLIERTRANAGIKTIPD